MQTLKKIPDIVPENVGQLLKLHYVSLMSVFYETQSAFLTGIYKKFGSVETANIMLCFSRNLHLEIIRQRERNLNYDVSVDSFWKNYNEVSKPIEKISSIVSYTSIPKETVRRKIKNLIKLGYLSDDKMRKGYAYNMSVKEKDVYLDFIEQEIKYLSRFVGKFTLHLGLNISMKTIEKEIRSQFSFYWYHFLSCQLEWLKMWQQKIKDTDLLLVVLQTIIPTLQYINKKDGNINMESIFKVIGKTNGKNDVHKTAVSATATSEVTGIPRATCIRKLEKLVELEFLARENKSRRYYVNQDIDRRTKNVLTKENVDRTISIFSQYLSIILNSLMYNKK